MKHSLQTLQILQNVSLAKHTSWLVGGLAEYFFEPQTPQELSAAQTYAKENKLKLTILGGGSNVLVSDKGVLGLVIGMSKLSGIEILEEENNLKFWALAGTSKSQVLKIFLKHKLEPACFLGGIPGQVGGGVVMNAGVSEKLNPQDFHAITEAVEVLRPDGSFTVIDSSRLVWNYRHCEGWRPGILTRVKITWPMDPKPDVLQVVKDLNKKRLAKQPLEWPSCGSVFRNPLPQHAGRLIEEAGLKGYQIGGAQISEKHANFIINKDHASANDIENLIKLCQETVRAKFNLDLQTEVVFVPGPL